MFAVLGLLAGPLGGIVGNKVGKVLSPLIMLAGAFLLINMYNGHFESKGFDKAMAKVAEKVAEAKALEQDRFLDRIAINEASYRTALVEVASAREMAPQIIERIRNAPPTTCSGEPIGVDRVELLNAAITGDRNEDPGAGRESFIARSRLAALRD